MYFLPLNPALAFILFAAAAYSDRLDGQLARKLGVTTRLGATLDPLADKIMYLGILWILASRYDSTLLHAIWWITAPAEISLFFIRIPPLSAWLRTPIPANSIGKRKLLIQCIALSILITGKIMAEQFSLVILVPFFFYAASAIAMIACVYSWRSLRSHLPFLTAGKLRQT